MAESESSEEEVFHDVDWSVPDPVFDYQEISGPVILATLQNDLDTVKNLIESGFSINTNNNQGDTPLHLAINCNHQELFDYILTIEHVEINVKNFAQMTPLMLAVKSGSTYFCERLLKVGASVDERNCQGDTLLHEVENVNLALMLLERNIDINATDHWGRTALHVACIRGDYEMACMLLCHGANSNTSCLRGEQPFMVSLSTCPPFLQEMLFDSTFDEKGDNLIYLDTLIRTIQNTFFFEKLLQKSCLRFNENSLLKLAWSLDKLSFKHFRQIVDHFHIRSNLIKKLVTVIVREEIFNFFRNLDVLEYFEFFCSKTDFLNTFTIDYLFSENSSIGEPPKVSEDILNNLICLLLSYGIQFRMKDLELIYAREKFSTFFETLLHMEVNDLMLDEECSKIVEIIYNIRIDLIGRENFQYINTLCASGRRRHFADISLLETSRNAARKHIISYYKLKNCGQFIAVVKRLNLPKRIQNFLILKELCE